MTFCQYMPSTYTGSRYFLSHGTKIPPPTPTVLSVPDAPRGLDPDPSGATLHGDGRTGWRVAPWLAQVPGRGGGSEEKVGKAASAAHAAAPSTLPTQRRGAMQRRPRSAWRRPWRSRRGERGPRQRRFLADPKVSFVGSGAAYDRLILWAHCRLDMAHGVEMRSVAGMRNTSVEQMANHFVGYPWICKSVAWP